MISSRSPETELGQDESVDALLNGRLKLIQSKRGYRFSTDALLLAQFVTVKPGDFLIDLGTGCGVIPLILLSTKRLKRALGLEIQPDLAGQAARNVHINGFSKRMDIVRGDIRFPPLSGDTANIVICNPPYRRVKSGRINPNVSRAIARHEILASLEDILRSARYLMKEKGRLAMIYPTERLIDLLPRARRLSLEPKRIQVVYPDQKSSSKLVLLEATLGARPGLEVLPPIFGQGTCSFSAPT